MLFPTAGVYSQLPCEREREKKTSSSLSLIIISWGLRGEKAEKEKSHNTLEPLRFRACEIGDDLT